MQNKTSLLTDAEEFCTASEEEMVICLPFPLSRTHCGFPLGNGNFGALVWGVDAIHVTVSRSDFWDHRDGQELVGENLFRKACGLYDPQDPKKTESVFYNKPWPGDGAFLNTRLPAGRFDLELRGGLKLESGRLDLRSGQLAVLVRSHTGATHKIFLSLHPRKNALRIHDPSFAVVQIVPRPAWEWLAPQFQSRDYVSPTRIDEENLQGWVQECPDDPALAALCAREGESMLVALSRGGDATEARRNAAEEIRELEAKGGAAFDEEVAGWWSDYWKDLPEVRIPDVFFNDFLKFALYKFGAATNPESPIPVGLQGPWCEEYQIPPWSGDYHFNVNIQQIYTLSFPTGKANHLMPLFDMLEQCTERFRQQAKVAMGIDDGLLLTVAMDDRGQCCGGIAVNAVIDQAVAGWVAQLYWLYYKYTGDREFLRDRALPFMTGVMRVYEEMLEWKEGVPSLPIGISAEYAHTLPDGQLMRVGKNPSYQLACIHMLVSALLEGRAILGEEPRPVWRTIGKALPPWTMVEDSQKPRIAIWENQDLEISHRHHAHLACIYPFDSLGEVTPEMQKILDNTLHRWIDIGMSDWSEWCLPWAAIIQARCGYRESPYVLLKLCRDVFINEGLATTYIPRFPGVTNHRIERRRECMNKSEIMQLDGTMGIATALYEMLAHVHGGVVNLFSAVPEAWRDVSFRNIRLPGLLLAGGEKKNGIIQSISLESSREIEVRLRVSGHEKMKLHRESGEEIVTLPHTIALRKGERIVGTFSL